MTLVNMVELQSSELLQSISHLENLIAKLGFERQTQTKIQRIFTTDPASPLEKH